MSTASVIADLYRDHHRRVLATVLALVGEFELAEDAVQEAIRLGRPLCDWYPDAETCGLLALMLFHDSRRDARTDDAGDLVLLTGIAAALYAQTFPDSRVERVNTAPCDFSGGTAGSELTVEFTVLGRRFVGLNGGPAYRPNQAVSFMVLTRDQEETDRYWNAIIDNGGSANVCGWCQDRWGFSWQITPQRLMDLTTSADPDQARRAFEAMMTMGKIDIAQLEAAVADRS